MLFNENRSGANLARYFEAIPKSINLVILLYILKFLSIFYPGDSFLA